MGGTVTAKRGSAYFRKLAARRKTHGGGQTAQVIRIADVVALPKFYCFVGAFLSDFSSVDDPSIAHLLR